jgi:DNA polymerase-3 subunit alpha
VVADAGGAGLRVFIDSPGAVTSVASVLEGAARDKVRGGRGPVYFCLMGDGLPGEVELELGQDFPVNPQIKGALRSLGGVIEVEDA